LLFPTAAVTGFAEKYRWKVQSKAVFCPATGRAPRKVQTPEILPWGAMPGKRGKRGTMSTPIDAATAVKEEAPKAPAAPKDEIALIANKWKDKRGSLIMALHDLQSRVGYVPRESAMRLGHEMGVPLARIYEVVTFYNYFKLEAPGKYVISVCLGTACHIKGSAGLLAGMEKELKVRVGQSTPDKEYHLQAVRCLGCCGLAPLVSVNGKVYGKLNTMDSRFVIERIQEDKPMVHVQEEAVAE
jgi:NADH-quinone oxidoreductase subunit E